MTLSKSSTKFCQPTETKKESRSLYPLLKVMMWIYEKFSVTVLSLYSNWAARPFHHYENFTFDQNHPAKTFKSYIVCKLKGDGFSSKTLGPAGRGSDFWKASLVSVKILVEAAFVVSTAFKAFWCLLAGSKREQNEAENSLFSNWLLERQVHSGFSALFWHKRNFWPHDKFYTDHACPKQIKDLTSCFVNNYFFYSW